MNELELECRMLPDAGPYVLGALDEAEAEVYREHLAGCAACRREVSELQPVVDMLPVSAPGVPAPAHMRDRIMAVVHSEAELLNSAGHEADRPARRGRTWGRPRWRSGVARGLAGAAALAAGVVIGAVAIDTGSPTHVTRAVVSAGSGTSAVLRQSGGRAELDVSHLAQAPGGRVYEVWLQRVHGAPEPTDALFVVDRSGNAAVAVPGNLHGVQRVMVTNEPVGGSLVPTTQPVINVPLAS